MSPPDEGTIALADAKGALRLAMRAVRRALPKAARRDASLRAAQHLAALVRARGAATVAVYARQGSELDLSPLVEALAGELTFAWPRVDRTRGLTFHVCDEGALQAGARGIREPAATAPIAGRLDVVLVPGLAFDRDGRRLGQGGGYYDRALPELRASSSPPLVVGVAFAAQVVDALPEEPHDARVDLVVTEDGPVGPIDDKARAP